MKRSPHDPIRIVPLRAPAVPAPAVRPQLTYRGGPLLAAVEVCTIFWGTAWTRAPQSAEVGRINAFFDAILAGPLLDQLAEYSVPQYAIGPGKRTGTATITAPALAASVSDSAIQKMLKQQVAAGKSVPPPTVNSLYFVYVQPGVAVDMGGSASCQAFCGYHDATPDGVFYAVMPYPDCSGCTGGLSPFNALTSTSSHELCEAITDPVPGQGWYDETNGEVGDICAWQTKTIGAYTVQQEWSNQASRCV